MSLLVIKEFLVAHGLELARQSPANQRNHAHHAKPEDNPVFLPLNRQLHKSHRRRDARYQKRNQNAVAGTMIQKSHQFLLLQLAAADGLVFGANRESPMRSMFEIANVI